MDSEMASRTGLVIRRILLGILGAVLLMGLVVYSEGAVTVYVREKEPQGTRIWLPVPALLVEAGMRFVPADKLREASAQLRPWLPAIEAASGELERCPDATLVEVKSARDNVIISKRADTLRIEVEDDSDTVHVSVPIALVNSLAHDLTAHSDPN